MIRVTPKTALILSLVIVLTYPIFIGFTSEHHILATLGVVMVAQVILFWYYLTKKVGNHAFRMAALAEDADGVIRTLHKGYKMRHTLPAEERKRLDDTLNILLVAYNGMLQRTLGHEKG